MQWELMSNLTDNLAAVILTILLTSSCLLASLSTELPLTRFSGPHRHPSGMHRLSLSPSISGAREPRQEAHQGGWLLGRSHRVVVVVGQRAEDPTVYDTRE